MLEKMAHTPLHLFSPRFDGGEHVPSPGSHTDQVLADQLENACGSDSASEVSHTEELPQFEWTVRHEAGNMVGGGTPFMQVNPRKRLEVHIGLLQAPGDSDSVSKSPSAVHDDISAPVLWSQTRVPLNLQMRKGDIACCKDIDFPESDSGAVPSTTESSGSGGCGVAVTVVRSAATGCVSVCCSCPLSICNESEYNLVLQRQHHAIHEGAQLQVDSRTERQCWWTLDGQRRKRSRTELASPHEDGPAWCRLGVIRSNGGIDWSESFRMVDLNTQRGARSEVDAARNMRRRLLTVSIGSSETDDGLGVSRLLLTMQRRRYGPQATHGHGGTAALPVLRRLTIRARAVLYNATDSRLLVASPVGVRQLRSRKLRGAVCRLPLEGWCDTNKPDLSQPREPPVTIVKLALESPDGGGAEARQWSRDVVLDNRVALNRLRIMVPCHRRHRRRARSRVGGPRDVEDLHYCSHAQMLTISSKACDPDTDSTAPGDAPMPSAAAASSAGADTAYAEGSKKVRPTPYSVMHYVAFRDPQPPLLIRNHTCFVVHFRALQHIAGLVGSIETLEPFSQLEYAWTCLPSQNLATSDSADKPVPGAPRKMPSILHTQERVFESYDVQRKKDTFCFRLTAPHRGEDGRQSVTEWSPVLLGCEGARRFVNLRLPRSDVPGEDGDDGDVVDIEMRVFNRAGTTVIAFTTSTATPGMPPTLSSVRSPVSPAATPHPAPDAKRGKQLKPEFAVDLSMQELSVLLFDENGIEFKELLFCSLSSLKVSVRSSAPLVTDAEEAADHSWADRQLLLCVNRTLLLRLVVGDLHLENYCSFQLPVMIARHGSSRSAQVVRREHSVKGGEDSSDSSEVDQITLEVTFAETFSNTRVLPFLLMLDVHVLPMAVAVEDTSVRELLRKLLPIAKGLLSDGQRERMPVQGPTAVQPRSNNVFQSSSRQVKSRR